MSYVTTTGLDGEDIDWEYPDPGASAQNFAALIRELGVAMRARGKLLTAAVVAIVNKSTGRCLDIDGPSTADGATIHPWDCHTGASQLWVVEPTDSGYSRFVSLHSGKALDVSTADGAGTQQWGYSGWSRGSARPRAQCGVEKRPGSCLEAPGCVLRNT
ncbi:RICIN domain-containing protein [Myxococcus sp. AB025B]|uniref:RICIN domain-containing protein n=1 Tax=Myxococcus sp. AB025B TaxID=2562794 RepID=UPI001141FD66|nr:RICIN domain-containing protein [Myxococcus sp. AB025B]